jgi:hypothetical protein
MRLYFWAQRKAAWKAVHLKRLCCSLLDAEVRMLRPDLLQIGEDDELDLVVELVSIELTAREILPELLAVRSDSRVRDLRDLALASLNVKQVVARFHGADAFLAGLLKDEVRKAEQMALARAAVASAAEYDVNSIFREYKNTVQRNSILRKELAERSAFKMHFSIPGIASAITLITAVFIVAGFLQVHYFYRRMGVDVALYFSVSDYLAASVEQIRAGAIAAASTIVVSAFGVRAGSLRSRLQTRATANARRTEGRIIGVLTVLLCGAAAFSIYIGRPEFSTMKMAGLIISYWVADYMADAFFKNRLVAMVALVATFVFGVNVAVDAYERSERLLAGAVVSGLKQQVHFKDSSPAIEGRLFGANSSYYFIYAQEKRITHIVPRDRVLQIDMMQMPR